MALAMLTLAKKDEAVQRNTVTSRRLIPSVWRPTPAICDLGGGSDLSPCEPSLWGSIGDWRAAEDGAALGPFMVVDLVQNSTT